MDLCSNKHKLKRIMEAVRSRYAVIPADLSRRLQEAELSLLRAEEKVTPNGTEPVFIFHLSAASSIVCPSQLKVSSSLVQKLAGRVMELVSGLENVKGLLAQRSPTVSEAQNVLKVGIDHKTKRLLPRSDGSCV